ncbi:MAG TPA: hypothetical protein VFQ37_00945 [Mycobacterium sp.]|nr:hypothetical protein [Mycobacterium sp.]
MADDSERQEDSAPPTADPTALAEQAEAEVAETEALAVAARARAQAVRLRYQANSAENAAETHETDTPAAEADETDTRPADAEQPPRSRLHKPRPATVLAAVAVFSICALLGVSGYIAMQHHGAVQHQQRVAAFTAAARQGVINMTSLDFHHVEEDVQRVLDSSTGDFKDDFERQAADFTTVVTKSQVVSEGTVNLAAVESMDSDSAVVLVSATSHVTNSAGAKEEPRIWRLRVTVAKEGDQIKMSKLLHVP